MPPYRPPSLSPSTSDDDTDVPEPSHDSKFPAAAAEQDSDEGSTGPDAPEAVSLTHAKRTAAAPSSRCHPGLASVAAVLQFQFRFSPYTSPTSSSSQSMYVLRRRSPLGRDLRRPAHTRQITDEPGMRPPFFAG
ncbi:hypothetical protein DFH09DRAFT_1322334 [Mycena vulgaris]|nr:hypothetical protein DFH09DRAFT_1322334 [Mycena vulgaris]